MQIFGTIYKSEAKTFREIDLPIPLFHKKFVKYRNKPIGPNFLPPIGK